MIDRHYYVRTEQDERLKRLADTLGKKPAQLVREGIDLVLEKHTSDHDWLAITRQIKGLLADDDGVEQRVLDARASLDRAYYQPTK